GGKPKSTDFLNLFPLSDWTFRPLNDSILVVGRYEGISFLRFKDGSWRPYGALEGFKVSSRLVEIDSENQWIWVSHPYQGVYRIRLEECCSPSPAYQLDYFGKESGLPSKLLNHIFWINGTLVVGGESGVYEFDAQTEQFISYEPLAERLDSLGRIKWLKEDREGNIWFLAGEELGILELQDRGMERTWERNLFTGIGDKLVNGFEMIEPIPGYGVVLGSEDGFLQYAPHIAEIPDTGFRTILKEVRLSLGSDSILFQGGAISSPQEMVDLAHHQSSLLFQFTGTSYRSTSRLAFQYRLIGLDEAWSNWTPKSEKEFTSLPPGEYQFEVRARKGREILTPKEVFAFRIAPPWYATRFAYSVYGCLGLIGLGSVLGLQRTRFEQEKAKLKAKQRQLEEVHQEEVRESEERISQLKNEKLHAEVQHKNQELAMATMHLVQKGEILSTLQTELKKILVQNRESPQLNRSLKDLVKLVQQDQRLDDEWERFAYHFDQVHSDFLKRLKSKYPDLSPNDFRLCSYLRMNLTSKEIAPLMNISVRGVEASRYRLRKKLQLPSSTNLQEFILRL
ncbi:MAG: triple tyrosine motif-containing protein, partial [Bacteroidota bacterium]